MSDSENSIEVSVRLPAPFSKALASTWARLSGPASSALEILQQRMFIWQLKNAEEIISRAQRIADSQGIQLKPVAPKFLLPYLEKAGLEEVDEDVLRDAWARLLINESLSKSSLHVAYLDVLSQISSREIALVVDLADCLEALPNGQITRIFSADTIESVLTKMYSVAISEIVERRMAVGGAEHVESKFERKESIFPGKLTRIDVPTFSNSDTGEIAGRVSAPTAYCNVWRSSILVLQRLGVVEEHTVRAPGWSGLDNHLTWIQLSEFGVGFFNSCRCVVKS